MEGWQTQGRAPNRHHSGAIIVAHQSPGLLELRAREGRVCVGEKREGGSTKVVVPTFKGEF